MGYAIERKKAFQGDFSCQRQINSFIQHIYTELKKVSGLRYTDKFEVFPRLHMLNLPGHCFDRALWVIRAKC